MFNPISTHITDALARLMTQYQDAPYLRGFIQSIVGPVQEIEDSLGGMNTLRLLASATGIQLDNIGTIVGMARTPGDSDTIYRHKLYAQIKINTSEGQPEQAIQMYKIFTEAMLVLLYEFFPGSVMIESDYMPPDQPTVDLLLNILSEVLPAGVRPLGIVSFDETEAFAYDGTLAGLGYGTASDSSVGGKYPMLFLRNTFFEYDGSDPGGAGYGSVSDPLVGGLYAT